ncbi:MAG TPA: PH domain-containing protein [Thermoanaerobaculia bacterium]|jgi:uncharacterized membrane protein YdbT with pleckstrin-like domain
MGYVDRNLVSGEAVEYRARLHWVIFVAPLALALIGSAAIVARLAGAFGGWILVAGLLVLAVAAGLALARWAVWVTSEFAITNRRVLIKVGIVSRHSVELLLTKVEGVGVDQALVGRLLGYGTIVVTGTGGTREAFERIAHPLRFRTEVQSRVPA